MGSRYTIIAYGGSKKLIAEFSSCISCRNDVNTEKLFISGMILPLIAVILEKFTERNAAPGPVLKTAASYAQPSLLRNKTLAMYCLPFQ
jgi:hypothetical protein